MPPEGRREARERRALEVRVTHEEALVLAGNEARRPERSVGARAERGDLSADAHHPANALEGVLAAAHEGAPRARDGGAVFVHDPAGDRGPEGQRDIEAFPLAGRERELRFHPRHVPRLVDSDPVGLGRDAFEVVRPVGPRAREAREPVRLHEDLRARHDAPRPVVDDLAVERGRRRERDRDRLALAERQLHVGLAAPPGVAGVDDDRAAPVGGVPDREATLRVRFDPARRGLHALQANERAPDGLPAGAEDDAADRVAGDDRDRPRNRAGLEAGLKGRREVRFLDRDAVSLRARPFELERSVLFRHDLPRHDPEREVVAAGDTGFEGDFRSRERLAGRVHGDAREPLAARQRVLAEILDLGGVVDVLEEHGHDTRALDPHAKGLFLAGLGGNRQDERAVRSGDRRGDRLRVLASFHGAARLVARCLPRHRADRETSRGLVGAIADEEPPADLPGARGGGRKSEREKKQGKAAGSRKKAGTTISKLPHRRTSTPD